MTTATRDRLRFTDEQIVQANSVNLLELARQYGYELEDKERKAFHAKHSGGLYFYKNSNTFKHFGSDCKGGAINFVMMEEGLSFVETVKLLLGSSYEPARQATPRLYVPHPERAELKLPPKAQNYKRAYWYLVSVRGIDPTIVSKLMNEKKIYQQADFGNCVFVGYNEKNEPKYCSKRGTDPKTSYKGDEDGSDKSYPFHIVGRSKKVYVLEAPIDAMSHAALAMLHGIDWQLDHRITTGCLSDGALQRFLKMYDIKEITFGYDNDVDCQKPIPATKEEYEAAERSGDISSFTVADNGRIFRRIPYNWGQEAALKYAYQYKDLGYKVAIHTPESKDFNVDLLSFRSRAAVREAETQEEAEDEYEMEA